MRRSFDQRPARPAPPPPARRLAACGVAVAALAAATAAGALAEELAANRVYRGGTRLEAAEFGAAFTVPTGWHGVWPGGEAFILEPETGPGARILALAEEGSRAAVRSLMAAPVDLGDGVFLHPTGEVGERGPALAARYEVRGGGQPLAAYAEALAGPHGVAVAYVLIAPPASLGDYEPAVAALVASTDLGEPTGAAGAAGEAAAGATGAGDRWDVYLKGKYIVRYYTDSGYTDEEHLWLCSDGSFRRRAAAGGFGGGASGAFDGSSSGSWTASGAGADGTLVLHYGDGSRGTYELRWDYESNHLYVDGKRWLHGDNEVCP